MQPPNPFDPAQNPNYGPRLPLADSSAHIAPLDAVMGYIRRFVSLSEHQARVIAVWIIHTYAIEASEATPYLAVTSAEKQCGKTRLLEVLETLVDNPWLTGRASAAVLPRKIHAERPTLLLDESDAAFNGDKEYAEALRGILNAGQRRGGKYTCCEGPPAKIVSVDFNTFCAKAIAGIGKLPDTVADRSIPIRLKRAARGERGMLQRFRRRDIAQEAAKLKADVEAWAKAILPDLADARPELPDQLSDRQMDSAEPLLAIADAAGGEWSTALRQAIVTLCADGQVADDSIGVQLLGDIRKDFDGKEIDRIASAALVKALCEIEGAPWAEFGKGEKPITATKLASVLKRYDIRPHPVRHGEEVYRGYERADFEDAWSRYLPPLPPLTDLQTVTTLHVATEIANTGAACNGVTVQAPISGTKADGLAECGSPDCAGCYEFGDGRKLHPPKHGAVQ